MSTSVRRLALLAVAALACRAPSPTAAPPPSGIAADVAYLASRELGGRGTGTPGADSAALYVARRYAQLALDEAFPAACDAPACAASYFQPFVVEGRAARNVAAIVLGADSALRGEYVVVGAHYDHLGRSTWGARDPDAGMAVRPGADDNASGTAAVLELARRLSARPPRRSVLLVHFDAEEIGLVGSRLFVERPPVARQALVFMLNLDMVGRLRGRPLTVDAPAAPAYVRTLVDRAAAGAGLRVVYSSEISGRSDHESFRQEGVPAVALFTGFHADYHTANDVAARLDFPGLARVVDVAEAITRAAADRVGDAGAAGPR